jgi:hypothetical protein
LGEKVEEKMDFFLGWKTGKRGFDRKIFLGFLSFLEWVLG